MLDTFPHFCPNKREIWYGGDRGNVSPLLGEKPIFGLLSENNTGMAALRAELPVTRNQYASPPRGNAVPGGPLSDSDEIFVIDAFLSLPFS